jgi:flavin reductase (DIM6/NTAB) family NADH-FMN oxidoreductase RutF
MASRVPRESTAVKSNVGDQDSAAFRHAASQFSTGVTVLSTLWGNEPHGMTVNAFASVSIRPLSVLAVVSNRSRTYQRVRRSGVFAVTVLCADQAELASWFAHPDRPSGASSFSDISWNPAPHTGCPVIVGGLSYFDCVVAQSHAVGDHVVLIGRVHAFDVLAESPPLLFVRSGFADLAEVLG